MVAILQYVHMHANGRVPSVSRPVVWQLALISNFQYVTIGLEWTEGPKQRSAQDVGKEGKFEH